MTHPGSATTEGRNGDIDELTALILRTAAGDREAFTQFYRLTSGAVYGLARRIIVDPDRSQETTQDVFLMVWEQAHKFDPTLGTPKAWLMTITHRRAVDTVRTAHRATARDITVTVKNYLPAFDIVSETVTNRLEGQRVTDCLKQLTFLQHESINLAFYGCLTYSQVAEHLGVPVPTVKTRIRSGLQRLKVCLDSGRP